MQTDRNREILFKLRNEIRNKLLPIVDNDYVLLDVPYHPNIGDTLIWQGELKFLKETRQRCLYSTSLYEYHYRPFKKDVIIILHGGGNMGDLYPVVDKFRQKILNDYPENRIIIFPQTVWYHDDNNLKYDALSYAKHKNLIICAREFRSYELLKKRFNSNKILLVPDLAFFLSFTSLEHKKTGRTLFLRRTDNELSKIEYKIPTNAEVHDWPTFEKEYKRLRIVNLFFKPIIFIMQKISPKIASSIIDFKYYYIYRPFYINVGKKFINQYDVIYTTRLHVMILAFLLGKQVYLLDNISGKVSGLYRTWLQGTDSIILQNEQNAD